MEVCQRGRLPPYSSLPCTIYISPKGRAFNTIHEVNAFFKLVVKGPPCGQNDQMIVFLAAMGSPYLHLPLQNVDTKSDFWHLMSGQNKKKDKWIKGQRGVPCFSIKGFMQTFWENLVCETPKQSFEPFPNKKYFQLRWTCSSRNAHKPRKGRRGQRLKQSWKLKQKGSKPSTR